MGLATLAVLDYWYFSRHRHKVDFSGGHKEHRCGRSCWPDEARYYSEAASELPTVTAVLCIG